MNSALIIYLFLGTYWYNFFVTFFLNHNFIVRKELNLWCCDGLNPQLKVVKLGRETVPYLTHKYLSKPLPDDQARLYVP